MDRKVTGTITAILLFYIISSPYTYTLVNQLVGGGIANNGCPTQLGLIIHSLVYGLIVYHLMTN